LSPAPGGGWNQEVLHAFGKTASDGKEPEAALIFDAKGNLYGTTAGGGVNGRGTVFELMPNGDGTWTEQVLYSFGAESSKDGQLPYGSLIFDKTGNLYGTTQQGGAYSSYGTVFELSPSAGGTWTETVLYSFGSTVDTGVSPHAGLVFDAGGNLYGTTPSGGTHGEGAVFELSRATSGVWTENVIYNFGANGAGDGHNSKTPLIFDAHNNLYGTTTTGGAYGPGTVFELSPVAGGGTWTENILFSFGASSLSGIYPEAGVIFDAAGNLYGTASEGGANERGTVFRLSPSESGSWTENVLCDFPAASNADGSDPNGGLIFDASGNLYGTTVGGGTPGGGTVFEIQSPNATMLTLSSSANPQTIGSTVTLTATVAPTAGADVPTGQITSTINGEAGPTLTLSNGSATYSTDSLPVGLNTIVMTYQGDTHYTASTSNSFVQVVNRLTGEPITSGALQFIPITPCRIADTRNATGAFGGPELAANATRTFNIPQSACNIPSTAAAYSLNITVVPINGLGYLTIWPAGETQPTVSTLNSDGRVKANAAIVPAGTNGGVSLFASDATQAILDIDGYFVPAGTASALEFYPVTPCRIADTRNPDGAEGGPSINGGDSRSFPIQGACNIPSTAKAYSLNVTTVPHGSLGFLTLWPAGETQPGSSTLNSSTGAVTANAAIVPAGTAGGEVSVYASDATDVILDVNGYFAPAGAGGLSLYTVTPCRALDTRNGAGAFTGTLLVDIETNVCASPSAARAYVLNATVVPSGSVAYLTLWPAGEPQPDVSTLNASDGAVTSNMAIVPSSNGSIDAYAPAATNLVLDISSFFAP
jgi:uncharacterized repeat protein (TIGR03803 family)